MEAILAILLIGTLWRYQKGWKIRTQNKNTKPYYWFTHFKVYLCISGDCNYYLLWLTIFRQCRAQTLIQEVENPTGKEKCSKNTSESLLCNERAWSEQLGKCMVHVRLVYGSHMATKKPPHSSYFSQILKQESAQLPLNVGHPEKILDCGGRSSNNLPQQSGNGLLDTSGQWKPYTNGKSSAEFSAENLNFDVTQEFHTLW